MNEFSRGFLPSEDPQIVLPAACDGWVELGRDLRKLVLSTRLREIVVGMPPFPAESLITEQERWRAASMLSYITSLYLLGSHEAPIAVVPANLARPFAHLAEQIGVPPILSYAFQTIYNWRRIDPNGPLEADNLTLLQNFLGGMDEEWFVTLHIEIEGAATPAILALLDAQHAIRQEDAQSLATALETIGQTLQHMHDILGRMQQRCDPYIYFHRVRPFMFGWKDNPSMPGGVLYEGVERFGGRPVEFRGETGAQSSIVPAIDATLGIGHERDEMRIYLEEMFDYMPPAHRRFIAERAAGPDMRAFIKETANPTLKEGYNFAVEKLTQFRVRHIEYAALYILKPANIKADQDAVGTGGTPFTFYLKKHINETKQHLL